MKAQLKVDYGFEAKKDEVFNIVEIKGKRVTIEINGRNVDFGFSEVQIVAPRKTDLFNLGKELMTIQTFGFCMRDLDIKKAVNTIVLPITKKLAEKSIHNFIYS